MRQLRFVLSLTCLVTLLSEARPQPGGRGATSDMLTTSYKLDVVLDIQKHPLLSEAFAETLQRELIDSLKRDLGRIADVNLAQRHPMMPEIIERGWGVLDDKAQPLDERKTHFIRVLYQNGQYEVQSRQVDGVTGYVSTLRRVKTSDRLWVSRIAALTAAQDFGIVGKVTEVTGSTVRLQLKGVGVEEPSSVRVQGRDLFYVFRIRMGRDGKPMGEKVEDSVLVVTGAQIDACQTRLVTRFQNPVKMSDRSVMEYRAIKLGTQYVPLQVRIVDKKSGQPLPGYGVSVSPAGFEPGQMAELGSTDAVGKIASKESFQNLVCVKISRGGRPVLITPIALLENQFVEIRLEGTGEHDALVKFESSFRRWQLGLVRLNGVLDAAIYKINDLLKKDQVKEAVAAAKEEAEKGKADLDELRKELVAVADEGRDVGNKVANNLKQAESDLGILQNKIKNLDDFVQEQVNPTPAQTKYHQAKIHEELGEIDDAIKRYEEALELDKADNKLSADVSKRLAKLQKAWEIKNDEHQAARDFVYKEWDTYDADKLDLNMSDAEKHLATLIKNGDFLTVRKLNKINLAHGDRLLTAISRNLESNTEEGEIKADAMKITLDSIRKLYNKAQEYLQKAAK